MIALLSLHGYTRLRSVVLNTPQFAQRSPHVDRQLGRLQPSVTETRAAMRTLEPAFSHVS